MFQNKKATVFLELLGGNGNEEDSEMKRRQTKKLKLKTTPFCGQTETNQLELTGFKVLLTRVKVLVVLARSTDSNGSNG